MILARGLGTRMRKGDADAELDAARAAVADAGVKALIPIDRPFLDYVRTCWPTPGTAASAWSSGPEHDQVRDYYGRHLRPERLDVSFAVQEHPRETADAVAAAEGFDAGEPFLMVDSDNYYPLDAVRGLRLAGGSAVAAFERDAMIRGGNIPAGRVVKFAAVDVDPTGHLRRIIETPDAAALAALGPAVYLSMNCWRFTPAIFEACRRTRPSPRGELEITGAVQLAIDDLGERFRVLPFTWPVLDLSCRGDVGPVSQRLAGTEVVL